MSLSSYVNKHGKKPRIGITTGDPAGIGIEIVCKALNSPVVRNVCEPLVFGALEMPSGLKYGKVSALGGEYAYRAIEDAVKAVKRGDIAAVATAPLHKESLRAAGVPYIGHTEIFAALTDTVDPLTMFETCGLRSFFLTRHISLRTACDMVSENRVYDYIVRCSRALNNELKLSKEVSSLAVAGLNPHCGEHGLFGCEERDIERAVKRANLEGINVVGPIGADSVFHLAKIGRYSAVLSLYHDQGHIACKTLDFERTVSLTLGMPFLRTSVDHGTAFDIAGKGIASEISMIEAIRVASAYATL